jgi:putative membrane protein
MKTTTHLPAATLFAIVTFSTSLLAQTYTTPATKPAATPDPTPTVHRDDDKVTALQGGKPHNLSRADRNFFEEAAKGGMKEVEVSNAVKARLGNPQVKAFAEMMVSDHTGANAELQALASAKGVVLPTEQKDYTEKWSKKDGDLDEDYVETMEEDHEEAVKHFEKAAKSDDAEIAAFAQKTLPKLQQHLDQVRALKRIVK